MTDHFKTIYAERAADYDALVSREDHQGNILATLQEICTLDDALVVELGAGTGRLTRLLQPYVRHIYAFDGAPAMLEQARIRLREMGDNWSLGVGDNAHTPFASGMADVVIAGWSLGHATGWYSETWPQKVDDVIGSMLRIVSKQGRIVILETMGTGVTSPAPPTPTLAAFYERLETHHHYNHRIINTEYLFESGDEATRLIGFFFGDALAGQVRRNAPFTFPEWTGIWWR